MRFLLSFLLVFLIFNSAAGIQPVQAANVVVPVLQDSVYRKKVSTLREIRLSKVVHQNEDYSCGAAALATILNYHFGKHLTERAAITAMLKAGDKEKIQSLGFSMLDMQRFAQSLQYEAEGYRISDVNQLKKLDVPVITLIETSSSYSHFIVVRKVDDEFVYISDPTWGNRRLSLEAFQHSWNKIILVITGPTLTDAQGLYAGDYCQFLPKHEVIRTQGILGPRIAMDPSFFFIQTVNPFH
jgi:uncharacterized protein